MTDVTVFRAAVLLHLFVAIVLSLHVVSLLARAGRRPSCAENGMCNDGWLLRPARGLAALVGAQLILGCATWVVNYGWPAWLANYSWTAGYVVQRESMPQAMVTTAHVATGSLILAVSLVLTLRSLRSSTGTFNSAGLMSTMGVAV
jgi:cytochrome c oxidase assembly protein subunit 15